MFFNPKIAKLSPTSVAAELRLPLLLLNVPPTPPHPPHPTGQVQFKPFMGRIMNKMDCVDLKALVQASIASS